LIYLDCLNKYNYIFLNSILFYSKFYFFRGVLFFLYANYIRMTAWTDFVKKTYDEGHGKNPNYKLKDAMKDASKTYKKQKSAGPAAASAPCAKKSRKSKKKKCSMVCKGGKGGKGKKSRRRARK
jgi:hypothetical protein